MRSPFKWSGDHTGEDAESLAGLLVTNVALTGTSPRLIDIAPSVLRHFGLRAPEGVAGTPLF